jgi:spore coat polysaccharide biosynthesis protein SpsF (cytidylyltransferase family)
VTPYLLARRGRFACRTLPAPAALRRPELRVCVDEAADLEAVRELWARLRAGGSPIPPRVADVVRVLDRSPSIVRANAGVRQRRAPVTA